MTIHYSHVVVRCGDLAASAAFYRDLLGFEVSPVQRDDVEVLQVIAGGQGFLYLVQVGESLDRLLGRNGWHVRGRAALLSNIEHLSLRSDDPAEADALRERLRAGGPPFIDRPVPLLGVRQFLLDDPNGVELEITFPLP